MIVMSSVTTPFIISTAIAGNQWDSIIIGIQQRGENRVKMLNIVVAVDESEESMRACEWACKHLLAAQADTQQSYNFILLHVQPTASVFMGPAYIPSFQVFELLEMQAKKTTQRILKRALNICERNGVKAETHVVIGDAKERICEAAAKLGAQFLVVGSHGHGPFLRAIRGSVSDYCARNATCPVVVVNKKVFEG